LILVVAAADVDRTCAALGPEARPIGAIVAAASSEPRVRYEG